MLKQPNNLVVKAKAPSNIAFVKYWGKYGVQMPLNPSISMTLSHSYTETSWELIKSDSFSLEVYLDGELVPGFNKKITKWFDLLFSLNSEDFEFLKTSKSIIRTHNTFPHSTGIASSASAFGALAMCLAQLHAKLNSRELEVEEVSELARLGSGSAARSIEGPFCEWGKSSERYASAIKDIDTKFQNLKDAICIVSSKEKEISSTIGHGMMDEHVFKDARIKQANKNYHDIINAMQNGDLMEFGRILEQEALSLHALMMSSHDSYTLLEGNSIELIKAVRLWRQAHKEPLFFTLDAGPNLHLIYPASIEEKVRSFLSSNEVSSLVSNIIYDELGSGAQVCN